jgi:hypothetical protein
MVSANNSPNASDIVDLRRAWALASEQDSKITPLSRKPSSDLGRPLA